MNANISARELSLSLGLSEGYINRIENKNNLPSMNVFFYICDYFHITPKQFFDTENHYPDELEKLIENLKRLKKDQLLAVTVIVNKMATNK